jgi:hypothetical protein
MGHGRDQNPLAAQYESDVVRESGKVHPSVPARTLPPKKRVLQVLSTT